MIWIFEALDFLIIYCILYYYIFYFVIYLHEKITIKNNYKNLFFLYNNQDYLCKSFMTQTLVVWSMNKINFFIYRTTNIFLHHNETAWIIEIFAFIFQVEAL